MEEEVSGVSLEREAEAVMVADCEASDDDWDMPLPPIWGTKLAGLALERPTFVNSPGLEAGPWGSRFSRAAFSAPERTFLKLRSRRLSCVERWGRASVPARKSKMERALMDFIFAEWGDKT